MNIYSISLLVFASGISVVPWILTLIKGDRSLKILYNIFSLIVLGWAIPYVLLLSPNVSERDAILWARIGHFFANFIPITWEHVVAKFTGKREPFFKGFYIIGYSEALLLSLTCITPFFVQGVHPILGLKYYTTPALFFHFYTANYWILVTHGLLRLIKAYREAADEKKKKMLYIFLATSSGFIPGYTMFFAAYGISVPFYLLPFMMLYQFFMTVALIRYKAFDLSSDTLKAEEPVLGCI